MNIKNIIFDVGNVIVKWSPIDIIKITFPDVDPDQQQFLFEKIFKSDIWISLNLGKISEKEAKLKYISNLKTFDIHMADRLFNYIKSTQVLIPGTTDLIKILYKNGYILFALTDNIKEVIQYLHKQYDFWQYFSHITVSSNIGLMKPGKEIFNYVIQKNNLLPNETIFIDDHIPNIETASSLGFHTILFSDLPSCLQELTQLGVDIHN